MKILKYAALVMLAAIPLLLLKRKPVVRPICGDEDNIFDEELSQR